MKAPRAILGSRAAAWGRCATERLGLAASHTAIIASWGGALRHDCERRPSRSRDLRCLCPGSLRPARRSETFEPGTETGGGDGNGRGLRCIEWRWVPESKTGMYATDMAYLLRGVNGAAKAVHDRHFMGLFPRTVWLELISAAGFEPLVVPFEHSSYSGAGHEVFLGLRPAADGEA